MAEKSAARGRLWAGGIALLLLGVISFALVASERLPEGPVPIAWDKERCAHCRMHISERPFAAQAQLRSGKVLSFDDPGCALLFRAENKEPLHAFYFHHHAEDRWIPIEKVAFVHVAPTPMGFELGAVDQGAGEGALAADAAQQQIVTRLQRERAGRK